MERKLKKSDVEKYMIDAIEKEIEMLIELLIEKIILHDDRIEIYYKTHNVEENPDEGVDEIRNLLRYGIATQSRMESSRSDVWNQADGDAPSVMPCTSST